MTVRQLFEDFKDYGGSIIRIIADNGNFDTRIGYNYIDKKHSMWRNFMAMYGDYKVTEWYVEHEEIKETPYKLITVYVEKNEYEPLYTEEKMIELCQSVDKPLTNAEKFKEVFGFEPNRYYSLCEVIECGHRENCRGCQHDKKEWDDK